MATRELSSSVKYVQGFDATAITETGDTLGEPVDTQGFNSVTLGISSWNGVFSDGTYEVEVFEGDTSGGSFTQVDAADLVSQSGTVSLSADNKAAWVGYVGIKQFVKINLAATAVSSGAVISGWVMLGHPHNAPVPAN